MKLPETKLNLGNSLWSMYNNTPVEWKVTSIKCCVTAKGIYISYDLCSSKMVSSVEEPNIGVSKFLSKKELLMNVFGDCLTEGVIVK